MIFYTGPDSVSLGDAQAGARSYRAGIKMFDGIPPLGFPCEQAMVGLDLTRKLEFIGGDLLILGDLDGALKAHRHAIDIARRILSDDRVIEVVSGSLEATEGLV